MGDALSALDVYWAAFAAIVRPLPADLCPMPEFLRAQYDVKDAACERGRRSDAARAPRFHLSRIPPAAARFLTGCVPRRRRPGQPPQRLGGECGLACRRSHERIAQRSPQPGDHRPRRSRQDDLAGWTAAPDRRLPREPGGRGAGDGQRGSRARARDHDPRQGDLPSSSRACASTSSTRPATRTSAARWSAFSAWWTRCCCSSTPSRA